MTRTELRIAIWLAYGKKDIYTGRLLENFEDLEIDHIIPKSINKELLAEKIEKYNLGQAFTINSIENLVPTFKVYNRAKSEIIFDESSERFFLAIAKGKKDKVQQELAKINKDRKLKEKTPFNPSYKINDSDHPAIKPSYFHSNTRVALNGYLPSKFDPLGSCAVEFNERGTMISLNNDIITTLMQDRRFTPLEQLILQYYDDKSEKAFVIIGTASIFLAKADYDQFLAILDDFLTVYQEFSKKFPAFLGLPGFEKFGPQNEYVLREISHEDWNTLTTFAGKIDEKQQSVACRFHVNAATIVAAENDPPVIKFTLIARQPAYSDANKLILTWKLPDLSQRRYIESGKVWTPAQTLDWVNNVLQSHEKKENSARPSGGSRNSLRRRSWIQKCRHYLFRK